MKLTIRPKEAGRRYRLSPQRVTDRLLHVNREEDWGFSTHEITRLAEDAPDWPAGIHCLRVPRIRFGRGSRGVARTFERLAARAVRTFGGTVPDASWRRLLGLDPDPAGRQELHLFVGDQTHAPGLSWSVLDCASYDRPDVSRHRRFAADELLSLAILFPKFLREAFTNRRVIEHVALGYSVLDASGLARGTRPRLGAVSLTLAPHAGGDPALELGVSWDEDGFSDHQASMPTIIKNVGS